MAKSNQIALTEFVESTLLQIFEGVRNAANKSNEFHARVNPNHHDPQIVAFDVAVTATASSEGKAGLGIFVAGVGVGTQIKGDGSLSQVNRITFQVPVRMPTTPMPS